MPVSQVQALFTKYSSESSTNKSPEQLRRWLVDQKAITDYQASIIAAGHSGPFRYGNYTVVERIENGVLAGSFAGRHTKTGYSVLLQFFPGSAPEDLKVWRQIEALVEQLSDTKHANVPETFESVTLPHHRFVVSQLPKGSPVSEKLPRKARLPWQKACALIAQVARGLDTIHQSGIVHNAVFRARSGWRNPVAFKSGSIRYPTRNLMLPIRTKKAPNANLTMHRRNRSNLLFKSRQPVMSIRSAVLSIGSSAAEHRFQNRTWKKRNSNKSPTRLPVSVNTSSLKSFSRCLRK